MQEPEELIDAKRAECRNQCVPPTLDKGATLDKGEFYHNLESDRVAKRYPSDADAAPVYGYRVKAEKWRWQNKSHSVGAGASTHGGASVNYVHCMKSEKCSILMHPEPDRFEHVVIVNIERLSAKLETEVVAQYSPLPDNCCHFDLRPLTIKIEDLLMRLRDLMTDVYPKNFPRSAEEISKALAAAREYSSIFALKRNVKALDTEGR